MKNIVRLVTFLIVLAGGMAGGIATGLIFGLKWTPIAPFSIGVIAGIIVALRYDDLVESIWPIISASLVIGALVTSYAPFTEALACASIGLFFSLIAVVLLVHLILFIEWLAKKVAAWLAKTIIDLLKRH